MSYLAPEMAKAGHDVHIAYIYDGPDRLTMTGVKLHRIGLIGNHDPRLVFNVRKLIRTIKPDIIQSWIQMMDIVVGILSYMEDFIWVMREPTTLESYVNLTLKQKLRSQLVTGKAKAIICNSAGGLAYWLSQGVKDSRTHLIYNAVPIDAINAQQPGKQKSSNNVIIYAGRLVSSKNVDIIIKTMSWIRPSHEVSLFIAGDGPEKTNLIQLACSIGLEEYVKFGGYVQSSELLAYFKAADAFISLSSYEGMPNSVCEAAACGTPLILSDIPAHRALFNEESAFFVPVDSVTKIADTVAHVLENKEEVERRSARALKVVKDKSPSSIAIEYLNLYQKLLPVDGKQLS